MKAVRFAGKGGPEVVELVELPEPSPGRGEVLVRVRAAALNRADLIQRRGLYPPPAGYREDVPGLELAGEVVACGPGAEAFRAGDRVMAIAAGEAQAELAVVHERMLLRVPPALSFPEAAALPEAGITSHDALFTLGGLRPGAAVLVHAAGSGIATAAIQIAHASGATVIGTSRTRDKLERAKVLGLDHGLLLSDPRFAGEVRELTGGRGVAIVLELVGGPYLGDDVAALAAGGRIVLVGTMGGSGAPLDLRLLMQKRGWLVGTMLRPRPLEEKIAASQAFARDILPLVAAGRVKPVVDLVLPAAEARAAHERMEGNASFWKIVLAF